ncbi:hypothetical protein CEXT_210741 [Caerostris extrusa]|uniref:Uncharacterized protein n=1 Tax=Caerostris extrusa TaxID=172846 RepID=A0AAV4XLW8_CAEEX|nr:hypothetical protein CEXT_210741 [Caerostris extrusa]
MNENYRLRAELARNSKLPGGVLDSPGGEPSSSEIYVPSKLHRKKDKSDLGKRTPENHFSALTPNCWCTTLSFLVSPSTPPPSFTVGTIQFLKHANRKPRFETILHITQKEKRCI